VAGPQLLDASDQFYLSAGVVPADPAFGDARQSSARQWQRPSDVLAIERMPQVPQCTKGSSI
jgi:hypothetical protein